MAYEPAEFDHKGQILRRLDPIFLDRNDIEKALDSHSNPKIFRRMTQYKHSSHKVHKSKKERHGTQPSLFVAITGFLSLLDGPFDS